MYRSCGDTIRSVVLEKTGAHQTIDVYALAHELHATLPQFTELEVAQTIGRIIVEIPGASALWGRLN